MRRWWTASATSGAGGDLLHPTIESPDFVRTEQGGGAAPEDAQTPAASPGSVGKHVVGGTAYVALLLHRRSDAHERTAAAQGERGKEEVLTKVGSMVVTTQDLGGWSREFVPAGSRGVVTELRPLTARFILGTRAVEVRLYDGEWM